MLGVRAKSGSDLARFERLKARERKMSTAVCQVVDIQPAGEGSDELAGGGDIAMDYSGSDTGIILSGTQMQKLNNKSTNHYKSNENFALNI